MAERGWRIGDVYAFTAARRWVPCQVIGKKARYWHVVVFDALSTKKPSADIIDGAPIYVIRHGRPKNEPLFLACEQPLPKRFAYLGHRRVALAFDLPKTFRTSPRAGDDDLPVYVATLEYARDRIKDDRAKPQKPYRSKLFPTWRIEPRAMRRIDEIVTGFAAKAVTTKTLRQAVRATNRYEDEIDTPSAEELHEKLVGIAERGGIEGKAAAAIVDAVRDW